MNEVEKMYRNSGIEKCNRLLKPCPFGNECDDCEHYWYPEFTAEKQLELIKWIACNKFNECKNIDFGEALAELINSFWQSLTEEEKQHIKEILE